MTPAAARPRYAPSNAVRRVMQPGRAAAGAVREMQEAVQPPVLLIEQGRQPVELARVPSFVPSEHRVHDEVRQLQQTGVSGGSEVGNVGHVVQLTPSVALDPYALRERLEVLPVGRLGDDDETAVPFVPLAVEAAQHPVESVDDLFEAVPVRLVADAADVVLFHGDREEAGLAPDQRRVDLVEERQTLRPGNGVERRTDVVVRRAQRGCVKLDRRSCAREVPGLQSVDLFGDMMNLPLEEREACHDEVRGIGPCPRLVQIDDVHGQFRGRLQ